MNKTGLISGTLKGKKEIVKEIRKEIKKETEIKLLNGVNKADWRKKNV